MEIPRLHYDGSFVIKVLVMWSQMEVTTRFRFKWPPRCFDDSDVVHCFSDWGWTRELKEVFQHQNHTKGIKFTSVLLWQKSEMDLSWSVETKPNTNRVKQPFRDVSVDGSLLCLRTLPMKHMYDKMILTHRFTSTLIGSGDLYSRKISVLEIRYSQRWATQSLIAGVAGRPMFFLLPVVLFCCCFCGLCKLVFPRYSSKWSESRIVHLRSDGETFSPH